MIDPLLEKYLAKQIPARDELFMELERLGDERDFPYVGPMVGNLLFLLARMIGAKRIFEMGSGFGYSALWFTRAIPDDGLIVMTEYDPANAREAEGFMKRAGMMHKVKIEVGNAHEVIERYAGPFDLIFIDCDKEKYPMAFDQAAARIRTGGLIVADNVLWSGKVMAPATDSPTRGIQEFTRKITGTPGFHSVIVPLRDGVSISCKLF